MRRAKWQLLLACLEELGVLKTDADYKFNHKFDKRLNAMLGEPLDVFYNGIFTRAWREEGDTDDEPFQKKFLHTWNSLVGRRTSVEEDKLTVFIHLLDLNPFEVMGAPSARLLKSTKLAVKDVEQPLLAEITGPKKPQPPTLETAMKKIVMSVDSLPLALLYSDGPRARPEEDHHYRWLPLYPGSEQLDLSNFMDWQDDGLHFGNDKLKIHLELFNLEPSAVDAAEVILTKTEIKETENKTSDRWRVTFLRKPDDKMARENSPAMAIVFESTRETRRLLHGACLRVLEVFPKCSCPPNSRFSRIKTHKKYCKHRTAHLQCVYDCPVRVWACKNKDPDSADIPRISLTRLPKWEVTIRCGELLYVRFSLVMYRL